MTVEVATFELAPQDQQVREKLLRSLLKSPPMPTEQQKLHFATLNNKQQFQMPLSRPIGQIKTNPNVQSSNNFRPEMTMQIKAYELSLNETQ